MESCKHPQARYFSDSDKHWLAWCPICGAARSEKHPEWESPSGAAPSPATPEAEGGVVLICPSCETPFKTCGCERKILDDYKDGKLHVLRAIELLADRIGGAVASPPAAQEQKPEPYAYAVVCDQHTPSLIWPRDKGNYTIAQGHGAKLVPLFASPIPAYTQADYDRNAIKVPADVKVTSPSIGEPASGEGWTVVKKDRTVLLTEVGGESYAFDLDGRPAPVLIFVRRFLEACAAPGETK